jgi:hypothetical protein
MHDARHRLMMEKNRIMAGLDEGRAQLGRCRADLELR